MRRPGGQTTNYTLFVDTDVALNDGLKQKLTARARVGILPQYIQRNNRHWLRKQLVVDGSGLEEPGG